MVQLSATDKGREYLMKRLAGISLFKDAGVDLTPFEARSRWRHVQPDEVLVDFDDRSSDVFFLVAGEVRVCMRTPSGREVIFGDLPGRQLFGGVPRPDPPPPPAPLPGPTPGG